MRRGRHPARAPATVTSRSIDAGRRAVTVNGQARGVTPLTLTLNPGDYSLESRPAAAYHVRCRSPLRPVRAAVNTCCLASMTRRVEACRSAASRPGRASTVDDVPRGVTPLSVSRSRARCAYRRARWRIGHVAADRHDSASGNGVVIGRDAGRGREQRASCASRRRSKCSCTKTARSSDRARASASCCPQAGHVIEAVERRARDIERHIPFRSRLARPPRFAWRRRR